MPHSPSPETTPFLDVTFPVAFRLWEPMTVFTDVVLAAAFFWAAARLPALRTRSDSARLLRRMWLLFFFVLGVSPLMGALVHGFALGSGACWKLNLLCIAASTYCNEVTALVWMTGSGTHTAVHGVLRVLFAAQLAFVTYWVLFVSDDFFVIVVDYGVPVFVIMLLQAGAAVFWKSQELRRESRTLAFGYFTLVAASAIQAGRVSPHPWFNHNDLFHVVACFGAYFLYAGAAGAVRVFDRHGLAQEATKRK